MLQLLHLRLQFGDNSEGTDTQTDRQTHTSSQDLDRELRDLIRMVIWKIFMKFISCKSPSITEWGETCWWVYGHWWKLIDMSCACAKKGPLSWTASYGYTTWTNRMCLVANVNLADKFSSIHNFIFVLGLQAELEEKAVCCQLDVNCWQAIYLPIKLAVAGGTAVVAVLTMLC